VIYSPVTKRRLADGEQAGALAEPATDAEIEAQLNILHDGIAALQSLDDLGSNEANQRAWNDMLALQKKYARLRQKLADRKSMT